MHSTFLSLFHIKLYMWDSFAYLFAIRCLMSLSTFCSSRFFHPPGHHGVSRSQQLASDGSLGGEHRGPHRVQTHHRGDGSPAGETLPHRLWGGQDQLHLGAGAAQGSVSVCVCVHNEQAPHPCFLGDQVCFSPLSVDSDSVCWWQLSAQQGVPLITVSVNCSLLFTWKTVCVCF